MMVITCRLILPMPLVPNGTGRHGKTQNNILTKKTTYQTTTCNFLQIHDQRPSPHDKFGRVLESHRNVWIQLSIFCFFFGEICVISINHFGFKSLNMTSCIHLHHLLSLKPICLMHSNISPSLSCTNFSKSYR